MRVKIVPSHVNQSNPHSFCKTSFQQYMGLVNWKLKYKLNNEHTWIDKGISTTEQGR